MRQQKSQSQNFLQKRPAAELNQGLERKLISYAAAAGAAGVAILSQPAEAKIVYTQEWVPISPISITTLDLNNDGIADFQFSNKPNSVSSCNTSYRRCLLMKVVPQNPSNAIWGTNAYASALGSGVSVGSQGKFQAGHESMAQEINRSGRSGTFFYRSAGPWKETTRGFLGLKFIIQGQIHYGWARLSVTATFSGIYAAISGYAYETEPNTPILTGQESGGAKKSHKRSHGSASQGAPAPTPSSLGALACGAPVLQAKVQTALGR